ncbi:MAG: hypothetical protein CVU56_06600 [Deltaproteobacteria bacterium HGW-Deltaproteobacteria-14]|jgi:branched-subunit amino acid aminotransferase/4-amino-4-deoxychorismate lyase|nr:MAG: hypothetical protein CVU56_06600 [Deltaproteobacteria bacterium HGW-Deltaproteobacteria-14]
MHVPAAIHPTVYLDGAFIPAERAAISPFDRGFLVADGIFETLYAIRGVPIQLQRHLDRLARAAEYLRLRGVPDAATLAAMLRRLLVENGIADPATGAEAALRLTISRGAEIGGPPTVVAFARALTAGHLRKRSDGVLGFVLPYSRTASGHELAQHKTLAYLASSLGQVLLAQLTPDPRAEGFFVDEAGDLLEGSSSNLFLVEGGRLVTPPISVGILPGTSRAEVIALAAGAGFEVRQEPISRERLLAADEAFITSSTLRVAPLVSLDGAVVGRGRRGPAVVRLQAAFQAEIDAEVARWYAAD